MARVLEILTSALDRGASRVVLETGQPPLVEFAHGMEPMGSEVSEDDLFEAVSSVADEDRMADLALGNVVEIDVVVGGHGVRFSADPRPDGIVVTVAPLDGAAPGPQAGPGEPDAPSAAFGAERLGEEDSSPPAAPGASGSWLPLDLDVDTGEIDLDAGEPEAGAGDPAFPSGLSDGVGKVQTTPSSDALPRIDPGADVSSGVDVAVAPTRGNVPVVGHEDEPVGAGADGADPSVGDTARDVPPVAGMPDPMDVAGTAVGDAEVAAPPFGAEEAAMADGVGDPQDPWAEPPAATASVADAASEAAPAFADAPAAVSPRAETVAPAFGEVEGRRDPARPGLFEVGDAPASEVDVALVAGRFAELASAVEPGRLVFLRLPLGAPNGLVRAMAEALVGERGARAFVVDDEADEASWRRMERVVAPHDVVFVDLVDPAARATDVLRLAESDVVILLVTRARAPDGARRILTGGAGAGPLVDWLEAVGTAWIAFNDGDWQFS